MSTSSIIQRLRASTSGQSYESVSSAEELEFAARIRQNELASHARHVLKRNKMKAMYEQRIKDLEAALNAAQLEIEKLRGKHTLGAGETAKEEESMSLNALLDKIEEESEREDGSESDVECEPPQRRRLITEMGVSQAKYIDYLERFADMKCEEVDALIKRLLKLRKEGARATEQGAEVETLRARLRKAERENEHLRERVEKMKTCVRQFVLRHRESKADRRTRELHELARLRAESEMRELDFYAFVSAQLNQFMDKKYEVNEESARTLVARAAEMLRNRQGDSDL